MTNDQDLPRPLSATDPDDRVAFRLNDAYNARDLDTIASMYPDDIEFVDRRPGLTTTTRGRDAMMEQLRVMTDLGMYQLPNTVLAARGTLKLLDVTWSNRDEEAPVEVPTLLLIEYSPDGLIEKVFVYEPAGLDAALEDLDARYLELQQQRSGP